MYVMVASHSFFRTSSLRRYDQNYIFFTSGDHTVLFCERQLRRLLTTKSAF